LEGSETLCTRCDVEAGETLSSQWRALSRLAGYFATVARQQADALTLPEGDGAVTRERADEWFGWEHDLLYGLVTDWLIEQPERLPRRVQRRLCEIAAMLCQWYAIESRLLADWRRVCEVVRDTRLARRDRSVAGWVHNELAVVHRLQGSPATASQELTAALELLPYRQRSARTQVLANLGLVQIDRRHVQESVGTLDAARRLRADRYGRALTDVGLSAAHLYGNDDHHRAAQLHADRCVRSFGGLDALPSLDLEERRLMAAALNNLGLALWRQGDHLGADEQWDGAYRIYDDLDDDAGLARVTLNRAAMLLARDPAQVDKAVDGLKESLRLRGAGSPTVGSGLCHLHLGHAYARKSDFAQACAEWRRAWKVFDRLGLRPEADEARRLLGEHGCGELPPPGPPHSPKPPVERPGWLDRLLGWRQRFWPRPRPEHW
jgi:tetratricopeptide (TPR) repeat protein